MSQDPAPYPLYTFPVPSLSVCRVCRVCRQRCCVVLCECCVMCYVVCSSVSLLSYVCSLSVGDGEGGSKILGGDKGAAPPRAQAPSPCPVGLAPSPQALQPLAEGVHRIQVAHHDEKLQEPLSILYGWFLKFLYLPEHIKEIGYTNE